MIFCRSGLVQQVVGQCPNLRRRKCERDLYKNLLHKAVVENGHVSTLGGIEFAEELIEHMDFYRAGKNEPSLKAFLADFNASMARI
jgi:hypothetical protein